MTEIVIAGDLVTKHNSRLDAGIRETVYYKSLNHPHIITCESSKFVDTGVTITFKKYTPVTVISQKFIANAVLCTKMFSEIVDALAYLESNEILQSDIKPGNIYYDTELDVFVLADFDLAVYSKECFPNRIATALTRPPEVARALLAGDVYSTNLQYHLGTPGDVFSLAITITSLFLGRNWYPTVSEEQAVEIDYTQLSKEIAPLPEVLIQCLAYDPLQRPTFLELARTLGQFKVYTSCKMIQQDIYNVNDMISHDLRLFEQRHKDPVIMRIRRASAMITSYWSLLGREPKDPIHYFASLLAGVTISALLCTDDNKLFPTADALGDMIWGDTTQYEQRYGSYNRRQLQYINRSPVTTQVLKHMCSTLDFHCLF
jgi:serine/threonine protein kinase